MANYTDEELDALIAFGEPYNREGDVAVLNALTQLKEARKEIHKLQCELSDYKHLYDQAKMYNDMHMDQLAVAVSALEVQERYHSATCSSINIFNNLRSTDNPCNCSAKLATITLKKIKELEK